MVRRREGMLLGAIVVVLATGVAGTLEAGSSVEAWQAATDEFFAEYVADDGRVVRRDEGGDTVSEGQAYAMLLAAAAGDEAAFDRVWGWTRTHLQRPDGLLSWHWRAGAVTDPEPATDADLDAAHALVLAAERFDAPEHLEDARRIARAVLDHETVDVGGGRLLVAGPAFRPDRVVNPSYASPLAFALLFRATGDPRWRSVHERMLEAVDRLTADGTALPPDWARYDEVGGPRPTSAPDGDLPRFAYDAARVPIRMALGCDAEDRDLAAELWPFLASVTGRGDAPPAAEYRLDGQPLVGYGHPAMTVAAAAAADAAGDRGARDRLLELAEDQDDAHPTYYGGAWVALGRVALTTDRLGVC